MPIRISKDRINMADKTLEQPVLKDYGETVVTANSGTSYTIDLTEGNVFDITLTGNCTFTFANPPASGTAGSFTLVLTQDATGSRTVTWPGAVSWLGGSAPSITGTAEQADILTFVTVNGGTTWFGALAVADLANAPPAFSGYLDYGWFGGGLSVSTVDRIDYSNDTATASVRGPLSAARSGLAATGSSNFGWFGGSNLTTVDRIDYSNDTATASVRGPLSAARSGLAAAGTSSYGWFGGGGNFPFVSTVDRIDYNNDTATASVRGSLSLARQSLAATGTSSYGWFGGGYNSVQYSTVDRIDYANDTATTSVRGPLRAAWYNAAATGNSSYGWFGGHLGPNSWVDRIDYAADTTTALGRGALSDTKAYLSATGTSSYGWFGGGYDVFSISTVDRIDYSNDTATASVRGPLSAARDSLAATQAGPLALLAARLGFTTIRLSTPFQY